MKLTIEAGNDTELLQYIKGKDALFVLWDLEQWLRNEQKYHEKEVIDISFLRGRLNELMSDYDLDFDSKIFE